MFLTILWGVGSEYVKATHRQKIWHMILEVSEFLESYYELVLKTSLGESLCYGAVKQNFQNGQDSGVHSVPLAKAFSLSKSSSLEDRSWGQEHLGHSFRKGRHTSLSQGRSRGPRDLLRWLSAVDKMDSRGMKTSRRVGSSLTGSSNYFSREPIMERVCPGERPKDEEGRWICCQFILGWDTWKYLKRETFI